MAGRVVDTIMEARLLVQRPADTYRVRRAHLALPGFAPSLLATTIHHEPRWRLDQ